MPKKKVAKKLNNKEKKALKKEVYQATPAIFNLNNELKTENSNEIFEALDKYLEETSEHVYLCITKRQQNFEEKWLRTEFTDEEIKSKAKAFVAKYQ